ncbi:MAG TPA: PIN domain-containing protein [Solirubrobacterales bacterium]|nr:PIN domain-containing protein [Solirubrobacterales bacterium]
MLLLDASVWVAAKDADERHFDAARALVLDTKLPVSALDLTFYEVANVIGSRWRRPDLARELCRTIQLRCDGRVVGAEIDLIEATVDLASEHGLTAYDAAYVAAARHHGWTLVSTDVADLVSKGLAVTPDAADYP